MNTTTKSTQHYYTEICLTDKLTFTVNKTRSSLTRTTQAQETRSSQPESNTYSNVLDSNINMTNPQDHTHQPTKTLMTNEEYYFILRYIQSTYPKALPKDSNQVPLAVGIDKQLLSKDDLPAAKIKIGRFLTSYTRSKLYRSQLIAGTTRVDLEGNNKGQVTEEEVNSPQWQELKTANLKKSRHDSLIEKTFEPPLIVQEFLAQYLPDQYESLIDLSILKVEKESFA